MARTKRPAVQRATPATDVLLGQYHLAEGDTVVGAFSRDKGVGWYHGKIFYNTQVEFKQCLYKIKYADGDVLFYTAEDMMERLRRGDIRKAVPLPPDTSADLGAGKE